LNLLFIFIDTLSDSDVRDTNKGEIMITPILYWEGATHVHVHTKSNEADRVQEVNDLLKHHHETHEPTGCNVKHLG